MLHNVPGKLSELYFAIAIHKTVFIIRLFPAPGLIFAAMHFTFFGHACFLVDTGAHKILFDPFITPNEQASHIRLADIEADYILLSHGHDDHMADCIALAQSTGATVVCNFEIHAWLQQNGIKKTHPMNTGGSWDFGGFQVKCTVAHHSSSLPGGIYGGNPIGFIVYNPSGNFYYSGDTALTLDMQLIPRWVKLNFAVLPIGDNFTMGYSDALEAAKMIDCREIIGVHYDTFGFIKIDKEKAVRTFEMEGFNLRLCSIGEKISLKESPVTE
jgi:L-ascorbate metabolism protein UlaG (beta-lactamase superfamily)